MSDVPYSWEGKYSNTLPEDANKSLEYEYASTYHNLLDKIIARRFSEVLPYFKDDPLQISFVIGQIKNDLIAYGAYSIGYPIAESEVMLVEDFLKRGNEAVEEFDTWLKIWYAKWLQRTKIVSEKQFNGMTTIVSKYAEHSRMIELPAILLAELSEVAVETLVHEGEIACTYILAKDLIMYALREEYKNVSPDMTIPDQLRLMTTVIRRTKSVASMVGPLVYIKVK